MKFKYVMEIISCCLSITLFEQAELDNLRKVAYVQGKFCQAHGIFKKGLFK